MMRRMSSNPPGKEYLVRASELGAGAQLHLSHPLNPRSELFMTRLSDPASLTHVGVSLCRVPPGKESFALHVHTVQEEWIYVLSGAGVVRIDDQTVPILSGDFVGFPANGPAHLVINESDNDLVYLQGGDRRAGDRAYFPELRRVGYQHDASHMALIPEDQIEIRPFSDWIAGQ